MPVSGGQTGSPSFPTSRAGERGPAIPGCEAVTESARVTVATASGDVELSAATAEELAKRLRLLSATRPAAAALEETLEDVPVKLDDAGKRRVLDELAYWLDRAGARAFPDDARRLFHALAAELHGRRDD